MNHPVYQITLLNDNNTCKIAVEERTGVCKSPFVTEARGGIHVGGRVAAVLVDVKDREL